MSRLTGAAAALTAALFCAAALVGAPGGAHAAEGFAAWLAAFKAEARAEGVSQATLNRALADVKPIPRVIELDRKQPEFTLTFRQYIDRVVPASRVNRARARLAENRTLLADAEAAHGVQARFLVAFWGIETDFGRVTGGFPVVGALATLAHEGRRGAYFRKELLAALRIIDEGHIAPEKMTGSWAGAMGQPQFMPSSFLNFAVDGDGDGRKDIWTNKKDVFASAANYLAQSGWRGGETWGREVRIPEGFDWSLIRKKARREKISKRISEWQALGVRRPDGSDLPTRDLQASLIRAGEDGPVFMVYNNFETILKWNRSTYFAVAVGTLADRAGAGS
ncbi:MAG: lytic murein transglycosylase [Rhodospirillales bacterium]